jgi:antitoxin ParD1/3/4
MFRAPEGTVFNRNFHFEIAIQTKTRARPFANARSSLSLPCPHEPTYHRHFGRTSGKRRSAGEVESYVSAGEVMRAAVRALNREEAAVDDWLRRRVEEALADPRPSVPAREVFKQLREFHAQRVKAERGEKV